MTVEELEQMAMQGEADITYKTVDGLHLPMRLYYPADVKKGERRPAAVVIHGGGYHARTDNSPFNGSYMKSHARYFALRGMVGVAISYRNCETEAPYQAGNPTILDQISDCQDALAFLRSHAEEFYVDANQLCVLGDSAGGHLSASLCTMRCYAAKTEQAAVPANLGVFYNPITDLTYDEWQKAAVHFSNDEQIRRELAALASPYYQLTNGAPPMLLMHGSLDTVVKKQHSIRFYEKARTCGVDCSYIEVPDAKHAFTLPGYGTNEQVAFSIRCADQFLQQHGYLTGNALL